MNSVDLHPETLAVVTSVVAFTLTAFIALFRTALKDYRGLLQWAIGDAAVGCTFLTFVFFHNTPGNGQFVLSGTLIVLALSAITSGMRDFCGTGAPWGLLVLVPAPIFLAAVLGIEGISGSRTLMEATLSLTLAVQCVGISHVLQAYDPKHRRRTVYFTFVVFATLATAAFFRFLFFLTDAEASSVFSRGLSFIMVTVGLITWTMAFALLALSRMAEEVEAQARESDARRHDRLVKTIIDTMPQSVVFKDRESRYLVCNAAYARSMGRRADELVGLTDRDLYPPELAGKYRKDDLAVLQYGETLETIEMHIAEGQEQWIETMKTPVISPEGDAEGVVVVFHDITERHRSARLLKESEQRYRELSTELERRVFERTAELSATRRNIDLFFDMTLEYLCVTDRRGHFTKFSPSWSRNLGWKEDELIGRPFFRFVHPEDRGRAGRATMVLAKGSKVRDLACRILCADHSWVWLSLSAVAVPDRGLVLVSAHDITNRVEAEANLRAAREEAERASRAKSQFISTMSHELRTPLNAVLGYAKLLKPLVKDEKGTRYAESILRSGGALLAIINDLLDLTKAESGRIELDPVPCDMRRVLDDLLGIFRFSAEEKGLRLQMRADASLPRLVIVDPARLRQVLINLVGNSIKFTDEGSVTLRIAATVPKIAGAGDTVTATLTVDVEDTGIGMTEEYRSRLFEPFSQESAEIARRFGGTGLGLAIAKRILDLMGGTIGCQSQAGVGTIFHVEIPGVRASGAGTEYLQGVGPVAGEEKVEAAGTVEETKPGSLQRVLVVDTDPVTLALAHRVIREMGMEMMSAVDEKYALLYAERADLVLLNTELPGIDCFALCRKLNESRGEEVPLILFHSEQQHQALMEGFRAGVVDYLSKPIEPNELRARLMIHLDLKRTKAALEQKTQEATEARREASRKSTELEALAARLDRLSAVDDLTGFLNRRAVLARLTQEIARSRRENRPIALLMGELDRPQGGHEGEPTRERVQECGRRIAETLREGDILGHLGRGKFLAVLDDTDQEGAAVVAERVRDRIGNYPFVLEDQLSRSTLSVGVSTVAPTPEFRTDDYADALVKGAEEALGTAKLRGGDRVERKELQGSPR